MELTNNFTFLYNQNRIGKRLATFGINSIAHHVVSIETRIYCPVLLFVDILMESLRLSSCFVWMLGGIFLKSSHVATSAQLPGAAMRKFKTFCQTKAQLFSRAGRLACVFV